MSPPRVAAVVPTLDRADDLRACLESLRHQHRALDAVVVVDNGSSAAVAAELSAAGEVEVLRPASNLGAPGGFEAGMRSAFEGGADLAWLLDDDAVAAPDALERMLRHLGAHEGDARIGGVVPTVEFGDGRRETGWLWGARAAGGHGQSPNPPEDSGPDVDWAPFAGLMLGREAWEEAGPIRADFVLWHADVEYCLRLRAGGRVLLAAPDAVVRHPAMPMVSRRLAGRTVTVGDIAPWREYYDTRNRAILRRALRGGDFDELTPFGTRASHELRRAAAVLAADPGGPRRVAMRALGAWDGRRGHMGRRPELRDS